MTHIDGGLDLLGLWQPLGMADQRLQLPQRRQVPCKQPLLDERANVCAVHLRHLQEEQEMRRMGQTELASVCVSNLALDPGANEGNVHFDLHIAT